eukprot:scaffold209313_cov21-Tisochrysis_lutea.AAC.1
MADVTSELTKGCDEWTRRPWAMLREESSSPNQEGKPMFSTKQVCTSASASTKQVCQRQCVHQA